MKYQAIRGTRDILPAEAAGFQRLEEAARLLFFRFGYGEIRTPTFEAVELFKRSLGETTDVVEKEMYVFEDRGGRKLALRPEGTAGVVRAYLENHLDRALPFVKLYYVGPMFRAERPQAGRYREFWQIGAEYIGNGAPAADAELLVMLTEFFKQVGLANVTLSLNSLGCEEGSHADAPCRPRYRQALVTTLQAEAARLCEDCQRRMAKNPLRALDCKKDGPKLRHVPLMESYWCGPCREHFKQVRQLLEKAGCRYHFEPRLVRGLDYYTRTVFEAAPGTDAPAPGTTALAAGGRYDNLVKSLGGPTLPAVGFALGCERTLEALNKLPPSPLVAAATRGEGVFVAAMGDLASVEAFRLMQELRAHPQLASRGIPVHGGFFERKIGAQVGMADRLKLPVCLILGEDEIENAEVMVKDMKSGEQVRIPRSQVVAWVMQHFSPPQ